MAYAFDSLSIELIQQIASELEDDKDLASFRLICPSTNEAIDYDNSSFWRQRFLTVFDPPPVIPSKKRHTANELFKREYQSRKQILYGRRVIFKSGTTKAEKECLNVVRKLIVESFNGNAPNSLNLQHISQITQDHGLLGNVLSRKGSQRRQTAPYPLMLAIQLALAHISLTAKPTSSLAHAWGFGDSQQAAYASSVTRPIFKGPNNLEIDMDWALHVVNFFKGHLVGAQGHISQDFDSLDGTERPQCWSKKLTNPAQKPGSHWKGSYAYLDHREIVHVRNGREEMVQDHLNGEQDAGGFQKLRLDFPDHRDQQWPKAFEHVLESRTKLRYSTATTRAQKRALGPDVAPPGEPVSFRFSGEGEDSSETFLAAGWLNPLPPQHGIPGWQRMTMMKYWTYPDTHDIDMHSLWAYEGVVLPGGMIMLGRWWHPLGTHTNDEYTGPFILWNVDASIGEDFN